MNLKFSIFQKVFIITTATVLFFITLIAKSPSEDFDLIIKGLYVIPTFVATLFFGFHAQRLNDQSRKEFELKLNSHLAFQPIRLHLTKDKIRLVQTIENIGLGTVYIASAIVRWRFNNYISSENWRKGECESTIPTRIKVDSNAEISFIFEVTGHENELGELNGLNTSLSAHRISDCFDIELIYMVSNSGGSELKEIRQRAYLNELKILEEKQ